MAMVGMTSADIYGTTPVNMSLPVSAAPLDQAGAGDDLGAGLATLVNPRNPLVIFGLILGITAGAVGVAGSARIGNVKVSGSAGKS